MRTCKVILPFYMNRPIILTWPSMFLKSFCKIVYCLTSPGLTHSPYILPLWDGLVRFILFNSVSFSSCLWPACSNHDFSQSHPAGQVGSFEQTPAQGHQFWVHTGNEVIALAWCLLPPPPVFSNVLVISAMGLHVLGISVMTFCYPLQALRPDRY